MKLLVEKPIMKRSVKRANTVSDAVARKRIVAFMLTQKQQGKNTLNFFDFSFSLNLPVAQIEQVLDSLEHERKITSF